MKYTQFGDLMLSHLGMGNMRLPTVGKRGPIDEKLARKVIECAYEQGVNYYDTAFRYHEGESERFAGEVLSQYPRDSWYLASKFPGHMLRREGEKLVFTGFGESRLEYFDSIQQIFQMQLDKCGVEYFDFYLLHGLGESSYDFYNDQNIGIIDYLQSEKKAGRIKHFGFSSHARAESIEKYLTQWKGVFELVQIQINYLDWTLQNAKEKYEIITKHGIPVVAMEPVRGGRLASLPEEADALLKAARPNDSPTAWALRFLQGLEGMQVILSGMSAPEHVLENAEILSKDDPAGEDERALLQKVVESMTNVAPCTACRYCDEACPQRLDIPKLISLHNEASHDNSLFGIGAVLRAMSDDEKPSACISCGQCVKLCPQEIDIPDIMSKFAHMIANPPPSPWG